RVPSSTSLARRTPRGSRPRRPASRHLDVRSLTKDTQPADRLAQLGRVSSVAAGDAMGGVFVDARWSGKYLPAGSPQWNSGETGVRGVPDVSTLVVAGWPAPRVRGGEPSDGIRYLDLLH